MRLEDNHFHVYFPQQLHPALMASASSGPLEVLVKFLRQATKVDAAARAECRTIMAKAETSILLLWIHPESGVVRQVIDFLLQQPPAFMAATFRVPPRVCMREVRLGEPTIEYRALEQLPEWKEEWEAWWTKHLDVAWGAACISMWILCGASP